MDPNGWFLGFSILFRRGPVHQGSCLYRESYTRFGIGILVKKKKKMIYCPHLGMKKKIDCDILVPQFPVKEMMDVSILPQLWE